MKLFTLLLFSFITNTLHSAAFEEATLVAIEQVGSASEVSMRTITIKKMSSVESSDLSELNITITDDGLLDDSVKSIQHVLKLKKKKEEDYKVITHEKLFKCWRGGPERQESYSSKLCP